MTKMNNSEATQYANHKVKMFPELKEEIYALLCLCFDEIADGASPQNEYDLFFGAVEDLIDKHCNEKSNNNWSF